MIPVFRADLHCHTTCSDGSFSPKEVVALAKKEGLSAISITDHDTLDAYPEAIPAAREMGILLGAGIELSAMYEGESVHILGYAFDLDSPIMRQFCQRQAKRREERNRKILEKLQKAGMVIAEEELKRFPGSRGRPHIAQLLFEKGYVRSTKQAFDCYLGDGKPCYEAGIGFSVEETIEVIHQAGGKAFLAHPHLFRNGKRLREVLERKFDGHSKISYQRIGWRAN